MVSNMDFFRNMLVDSGLTYNAATKIVTSNGVISTKTLTSYGLSSQAASEIARLAKHSQNIPDKDDVSTNVFSPESYITTADGLIKDTKLRIDMNMTYKRKSHTELYFDRLYSIYPDLELTNVCQYVILVRPDLNIIKPNTTNELVDVTSSQRKLGYSSTSSCANDQLMRYMNKYHNNILRHLTRGLSDHNDFMPYLLGRAESLQVPDYGIKNYYITQPHTGLSLPYAGNALESMSGNGGTFDITFREDSELKVHKLFQAWIHYIDGVTRNLFTPARRWIVNNIIDYTTSVYLITCKPDSDTILYWTKFTGAFPISVPNSDLSFNLRGSVNNKVSIPFAYFLAESMDPMILVDFNQNAHVGGDTSGKTSQKSDMAARIKDAIPIYSTSKLSDYKFDIDKEHASASKGNAILGTGYGLVGAPFIYKDPTTDVYKLGWKNPYN